MSVDLKKLPHYREAKKYHFFFVNGILTNPSDIKGWTDRMVQTFQNNDIAASAYEYGSGAVTRFLWQSKRVDEIAETLSGISKPIVYVGHSNGCELFSLLCKRYRLQFDAAHLFAPAVWPDFNDNGFNQALTDERIENLFIYGSKADSTLQYGRILTGWLHPIGLGYGDLGYKGPKSVDKSVARKVHFTWHNELKHSDWWRPGNFENSATLCSRIDP